MLLRYKKLTNDAIEPTYGHIGDAGLDLYSAGDYVINVGETAMIHTGIAVEIPAGYFGAVYARSGLAVKQGLRPANCVGVVDATYRGELIVALHNDSSCDLRTVKNGDRIAQLVIQPCMQVILQEVIELADSERGTGGFFSTDGKITKNKNFDGDERIVARDCIYDYEQITLYDVLNESGENV